MIGQTVEAFILGTLCAVGMAVLNLPYAPMVGSLVGITAFVPIVGAIYRWWHRGIYDFDS